MIEGPYVPEPQPTSGPTADLAVEEMTREQLLEEKRRLERLQTDDGQAGQLWAKQRETLFPRLEKIRERLQSAPSGNETTSDLQQLDLEQLNAEINRLELSKGNNPGAEPWDFETMAPRLEEAYRLRKNIRGF